ncbi:hypothetical protein MCOR04_005942 [Pyricularia oryzae]|nr:hypothetical protein MCOR17_011195 [Pyricularia oryzae]KAI6579751.1 hypothetical protein MCOR04_005942 [Pyricularia oryzae]
MHVSKFAQLTALLAVAAPVLASNQATDSPRGTPLEPETVTLPGHIRPVKVKSFKKKILPEGNPSPKAPQDSAALDKRTTLNWAHGVELIDGYRKNTLGCPASSLTKNPTLVLTGKPKEGEEAKKPEESTKPKEPQEKPKE